ncbi:MAG: DUF3592 domain-containing protein [Planctomycetota bacterium]
MRVQLRFASLPSMLALVALFIIIQGGCGETRVDWKETQGTVFESEASSPRSPVHLLVVKYRYEVDGNEHEGEDDFRYWVRGEYAVGTQVTVFYNAIAPEESSLIENH